jgi:ribosomal protein S12 methylthiotransferase accessory factor
MGKIKDITVTFPGGQRVDAHYDGRTVATDQSPEHGGEGSAPEPFDLFWVSLATCVGVYALNFCQARKLDTTGLGVRLRTAFDPEEKRFARVEITITPPRGFPERHRKSLQRVADLCAVKKHILNPPSFHLTVAAAPAEEPPGNDA